MCKVLYVIRKLSNSLSYAINSFVNRKRERSLSNNYIVHRRTFTALQSKRDQYPIEKKQFSNSTISNCMKSRKYFIENERFHRIHTLKYLVCLRLNRLIGYNLPDLYGLPVLQRKAFLCYFLYRLQFPLLISNLKQ